MSTAIITGIFGLLTVVVPTLVAIESGPRKHLKLIREEAETLKALPEDLPGREYMELALFRQISLYAGRAAPEIVSAKRLRRRTYWMLWFLVVYIGAALGVWQAGRIAAEDVRLMVRMALTLIAVFAGIAVGVNFSAAQRRWRTVARIAEIRARPGPE